MNDEDKKLLAVCLPLYDGKVCWETWFQLRLEEELMRQLDIGWRIDIIVIAGSSLIARSRNEAVWNALYNRNADAIMWIDGDMNWTSGAICRMIAHDMDICAAGVPKKEAEIAFNVRFLPDRTPTKNGLIEVDTVGTGFMFTKRRVYEIMAERAVWDGTNTYLPPNGEGGGPRKAFFQAPGSWGEDTYFCHVWRKLGGKIYVDPAITMQHIIAPKWSVKACLGEWLKQQDGADEDGLTRAVMQIRAGAATPETWQQLYDAWGNGVYAATPDFLACLYDLAKIANGPILECGSGISSLVLGLANPDAEIHVLEHDPAWLMRIQRLLSMQGVSNVHVHIADMEDGFYVSDMVPDMPFAMAVFDGPPRHIGDRAKGYERLASRIEGAIVAADDTNDPKEALAFQTYVTGRAGEVSEYGNNVKRFSFFIPAHRQKEAA